MRPAAGDLRRFLDTYRQVSGALFEPQDRQGVAVALEGPVRRALGADRAVVFTSFGFRSEAVRPGAATAAEDPLPLVGSARPGDGPVAAEAARTQRVVGPVDGSDGETVVAIPLADARGPLGAALYAFGSADGALDPMWFDAVAVECLEAMERGRLWEAKVALREQAQRDGLRVESSERRLRRVLDGLFVFVGLLEADGTLLEANRAALDAGGLEPGDVVGRPFWDAYWWSWSEQVQAQLRAAVARAAAGVASRYDVEVRMAGGRLITIDFQLAPLYDDAGVITHLVPSGLDITERKYQEAELERRLRAEQRARERAEALQLLAEALGAASDSVEVYDAVAHSAASAMGARFANLAVRTDQPGQAALYNGPGLPGDMAQRWSTVSVDSSTPIGAAFRSGVMVWAADPLAIDEQFPAGARDAAAAGLAALGAVPVTSADGEVVAVIGLAWGEPQPLNAELHASLSALSAVVGQALERARRFDAERHVAQALQQVLLPAGLPSLPTMALTARYLAAESTLAVGGDWYECFELPGGRLIIALGDVVGRGLEAAATVGQLRAAVAALAATVDSPAALLDRLDGFVRHFPGAVCTTVVCVELTLATGELRYACAGHPPPLLVRPDGTNSMLEGGRSTPIGISAGPRPVAEHRLEVGERLLLYTDGLV
ncbi:MAG: SpoIIE family protein phosphatase [Acidimicrobiales bacterium]|nr:SpoIIE family protein phosphatase [Acidimicrobiales bacterium]